MAGLSSEKEVSLESGRNIFNKMNKGKYDALPIFMDTKAAFWLIPLKLLMKNSTKDVEEELVDNASRIHYEELSTKIDIAFLALHGKYGEDGCVQGMLELLGVPYTGSGVLASALGMDKLASRRVLSINGIDTPKTVVVSAPNWRENISLLLEEVSQELAFPCIVKPAREGCSTAVAKVDDGKGLPTAIEAALLWDTKVLVEEFIEGMEVTCGVIGDDDPIALIPSETIPTGKILSLEDKFLYGQGENKTPARVSEKTLEKIQDTARRSFLALSLQGYARIDMFVRKDGRITVLEPNTLPGLTPSTVLFHQAAAVGITPAELIERIIALAFKAHSQKRGPL